MASLKSTARNAVAPYAGSSDGTALTLLACDFVGYLACLALIFMFDSWVISGIAGVIAGIFISSLFTIGHDAAHQSFTSRRWLNSLIGRIVFLPSLHNYTLWVREHNRAHHWAPNVQGLNSWSPLSKEEYDALPAWRKALLHVLRSPLGPGPYYISARWWRAKFFPRPSNDSWTNRSAWLDFLLLVGFIGAFIGGLAWAGEYSGRGIGWAVGFGAVLPFLVWNYLMGVTVFLHHTNPHVPWFKTPKAAEQAAEQTDRTVHVQFPRWYGIVSHDIMEHPAHHVNVRIPCYRLHRAQHALNEALGERAHVERASLGLILETFRKCKLYDYDRHSWLTFDGEATRVVLPDMEAALAS